MLGDSSTATTPDQPPPLPSPSQLATEGSHVGGGPHSGHLEEEDRGREDGDMIMVVRSYGGNRWPRQETLALLKIRSDMDVEFKEVSVEGPLWEKVSRKLVELGYNRSAKKCREKFENVFKYHKRTKEGRTGKSQGKTTYRFFNQLEAFESQPSLLPPPTPSTQMAPPRSQTQEVTALVMLGDNNPPAKGIGGSNIVCTVPTTTPAISFSIPSCPQANNPTIIAPQPTNVPSFSNFPAFSPDVLSNSSSSSMSSDVEIQGRGQRKRKWKKFFQRLMKEVIQKQEDMQRRFLEAIEKREQDKMAREASWRVEEMARIKRECEISAQERAMAAAKDVAVLAFLQKLYEQNPGQVQVIAPPSQPPPTAPSPPQTAPTLRPMTSITPTPTPQPLPQTASVAATAVITTTTTTTIVPRQQQVVQSREAMLKSENGDQNLMPPSSSRWPKVEVQALIRLRTSLDSKYQESGPKGLLWEEISSEMRKLGYNRNAKRCKEKWENINKYFKKVKESNKKRPEDSKTCPYFQQLDALYKGKNKLFNGSSSSDQLFNGSSSSDLQFRPQDSVPLLVQPEQQWPPLPSGQQEHIPHHKSAVEDMESDDHQDEDDKDNDDEEEDEAGGYEIVANSDNKGVSVSTRE